MVKFAAIIEARMTSKRLPGKILYEAGGKKFFMASDKKIKKSKRNKQNNLSYNNK